jgi:hypothetical protein
MPPWGPNGWSRTQSNRPTSIVDVFAGAVPIARLFFTPLYLLAALLT